MKIVRVHLIIGTTLKRSGMDILTTPVFDRPLFSPDVIILFENLDIDLQINVLILRWSSHFG